MTYFQYMEFHTEDDERAETYTVKVAVHKETGAVTCEEWFNADGVHSRPGGKPAIQAWSASGRLAQEHWLVDGKLHRDGKPAIIDYDNEERIASEQWFQNDVNMRLDGGPSNTIVDPDTGVFTLEEYTDALGQLHRDGGLPAKITRDNETGEITSQEYHRHGQSLEQPFQPPGL